MSATEKRPCQVPDCPERIPPGLVMCDAHWELVSPDLRRKIYRFYHLIRAGKLDQVRAEYDQALEAAIRQVLEATYAHR
jgi:hypothetical protein